MPARNNKQLILFVKAPVPGQCKSRLIPMLGAIAACEFYKQLVLHCLRQIASLKNIDIALYVYPDTQHDFIGYLTALHPLSLHSQCGNNLGDRMHHALESSLKDYKYSVLIGTDCPEISASYIMQAFQALQSQDVVLGPACDGGYVLIGTTKSSPALFQNINWSTDKVLQQSLHNAQNNGYSYNLLDTLWDIDVPQDYIQHHNRLKELLNITPFTGDHYGPTTG